MACWLLACQWEGGGCGPLPFGGLLGHQGDCGGLCVDGQAALDGFLGSVQVGQGAPAADGQVGGGAAELALVWGEGGKGAGDQAGQGTEGGGVAGGEPEHLIAEPGGAVELEAELAERREQVLEPGELRGADGLGRHERGEHGDVGRDAEPGTGVEAFAVPRHGGFGLRDLDQQAAARAGDCHGRDVSPVRAVRQPGGEGGDHQVALPVIEARLVYRAAGRDRGPGAFGKIQ